jgi:Golgi phosphoprotein 3 (GPP34)
VPDRIATDLLRMARNPVSGRLRHQASLEVAVRAALLAEMALNGQVIDQVNAPTLVGDDEPTGDRIVDAIRRAVEQRPNVMRLRWFRHVRVDRRALCAELVESGRWEPQPGWRTAFTDAKPDEALALGFETKRVANYERAPADAREAVLAVLAVACGATGARPRPTAARRDLKPIVDSIGDHTTQKIVVTASNVIRRARRATGGVG